MKIFSQEKIFIIILILFSILINQYYGSRGAFPLDSFLFFDTGYRILGGEVPFVDFWLVKGPLLEYMQALFFYIFGVNWHIYVLHASLMNALVTISTFFVLKNFKLKISYCFLYSLLFSILAYPSSGTPFIDHHSAFFSLLGIYSLLLAINNNKKLYWILLPIFLGLAFFSKQVPSSYIILSVGAVLILYSLKNKRFDCIKYSFIGLILFIFIVLIFGKLQEIKFSAFLDQYIFYPSTIGEQRFENLNFTFRGIVGHFKFIYLAIIPLFYVNIKKLLFNKNYTLHNDFYFFLSLFLLTVSFILHQILTKNQTFIFFLIPILTAFSQISLIDTKLKYKNLIFLILISLCLFATLKYHLRFNENRKFHELENVDFKLSIDAKKIDKKLSGLKWITPEFPNNPSEEIQLINQIKSHLSKDSRNKMIITNYTFFSNILDEKIISPSRSYTGDGTTIPIKENKYKTKYKKLMINLIKKNKISVIYIVAPFDNTIIYNYIDRQCFEENYVLEQLKSYEIKNCIDING